MKNTLYIPLEEAKDKSDSSPCKSKYAQKQDKDRGLITRYLYTLSVFLSCNFLHNWIITGHTRCNMEPAHKHLSNYYRNPESEGSSPSLSHRKWQYLIYFCLSIAKSILVANPLSSTFEIYLPADSFSCYQLASKHHSHSLHVLHWGELFIHVYSFSAPTIVSEQ